MVVRVYRVVLHALVSEQVMRSAAVRMGAAQRSVGALAVTPPPAHPARQRPSPVHCHRMIPEVRACSTPAHTTRPYLTNQTYRENAGALQSSQPESFTEI